MQKIHEYYFLQKQYHVPMIVGGTCLVYAAAIFSFCNFERFFFVDDSFFYMVIARNIARGLGSTFDQINPTNGYHPLWMMLLAGLYRITYPFSPSDGIKITSYIDVILIFLTVIIYNLLLKTNKATPIIHFLFTLILITILGYQHFGLETHLLILIFGIFQLTILGNLSLRFSNRTLLKVSLLGMLLILTRLDSTIFVGTICLGISFLEFRRYRNYNFITKLIVIFLPIVISVTIYLFYNKINYGEYFTISSYLKMGPFQFRLYLWQVLGIGMKVRILFVLITSVIVIVQSIRILRNREIDNLYFNQASNYLISGFASLVYLVFLLKIVDGLGSWYLILPTVNNITILFMINSSLVCDSAKWPSILNWLATIILIAFNIALIIKSVPGNTEEQMNFAKSIKSVLDSKSVVFMVDRSGKPAWDYDCKLINGDGLVNSFDYLNYVKNNRIKEFLRTNEVKYVLHAYPADKQGNVVIGSGNCTDSNGNASRFTIFRYKVQEALVRTENNYLFRFE